MVEGLLDQGTCIIVPKVVGGFSYVKVLSLMVHASYLAARPRWRSASML